MEYIDFEKKIIDLFENTKFCVLATANKNGVVSASQVCLINDGLKLYFQTDRTFEKVRNILENPNVAINIGAYYFKGQAKVMEHPNNNDWFIDKIKTKHPETYKSYTNLPNEVLIEVELTEAKIWGGGSSDVHNQEIMIQMDLKNKNLKEIICDKM